MKPPKITHNANDGCDIPRTSTTEARPVRGNAIRIKEKVGRGVWGTWGGFVEIGMDMRGISYF
eukprot:1320296-Amorphochlora_amoeboformis.AAC.2